MPRYIDAEPLIEFITKGLNNPDKTKAFGHDAIEILAEIEYAHTADVVPKSEVAELLRLMFNDDCACNYNGNDEWLPFKCKFALTDCPMPKERLGCWMEFVEYGLAELKKKYTEN